MATTSYKVKSYAANAKTLCKKMLIDYESATALKDKYPDRVKIVFYEDIKSDVYNKLKTLYDFIGMEYSESDVEKLDTVKTNTGKLEKGAKKTRSEDNAHWWRSQLTYEQYRDFYNNCEDVAKLFNITYFSDSKHMLNMNVPDMTLPKHLVI